MAIVWFVCVGFEEIGLVSFEKRAFLEFAF
jgi:hypothetical protein